MIFSALLLLGIGVFGDGVEDRGIRPDHIQFVGTEQDQKYTISCFQDPINVDTSGDTVSVATCTMSEGECPALTLNADGTITVVNFPSSASESIYECTAKEAGDKTYQVLIGVIEIPEPALSSMGKTTFDEETESPVEMATCNSGYGRPAPTVVWVNQNDEKVGSCDDSNVDEFTTEVCIKDTADAHDRHNIELVLVENVKKGESVKYTCEVTYAEAVDGAKVMRTMRLNYPAEGCIAVAGDACPGSPSGDPGQIRGGDTDGPTAAPIVEEAGTTAAVTGILAAGNPEQSQMHNALLGTATGIVIFAIIVILIWFIRKKNREGDADGDSNAEYKPGDRASTADSDP